VGAEQSGVLLRQLGLALHGVVDHRVVFHGSGMVRRSLGPVPGLCSTGGQYDWQCPLLQHRCPSTWQEGSITQQVLSVVGGIS
jgi:hypothetical protein